jgi:hypothetical protein
MELVGWGHLSGGHGNAGMRPERRLRGRNHRGRRKSLPGFLDSGAKAINPRGLGTESPTRKVLFLWFWEWSITDALGILWMSHFTSRSTHQ